MRCKRRRSSRRERPGLAADGPAGAAQEQAALIAPMLGIVIAVAAVMATVSIGQGAQAKVAQQWESLGANLLVVSPGSMAKSGVATGLGATQNLTREDAAAIERELTSSVSAVAPVNKTPAQIVYGDQNWF